MRTCNNYNNYFFFQDGRTALFNFVQGNPMYLRVLLDAGANCDLPCSVCLLVSRPYATSVGLSCGVQVMCMIVFSFHSLLFSGWPDAAFACCEGQMP